MSLPRAVCFTVGGAVMCVGLKQLIDNSVILAILCFRLGIVIMTLAYLGVLGKHETEPSHIGLDLKPPTLPERRPQVVPDQYGVEPGRISSEGLHVVNDGESAFDVEIPPVDLADGWVLDFEGTENRIGPNGRAFFRAASSKGNDHKLGVDGIWRHLHATVGVAAVLNFEIKYRDSTGRSYRSVCERHRDVMKNYPGFDAKFVRQETA